MEEYIIKTKHLGLRFIKEDDDKFLKTVDRDPVVKEFYPEGTLTDKEIKDYINECLADRKFPCFIIFKLIDNEFVGEAYFGQLDTGEIKIGYLFHQNYWHRGYATETLKALLNWAKTHYDTEYIIAYADKNNVGSFRVMQKCGMKYYKKGRYLDMDCYFYRIKNR